MIKCALQYFLEIKSTQIKCWFWRRGENRSTRRKTSRSRVENQQTQPTYDAEPGANPAPLILRTPKTIQCVREVTLQSNFAVLTRIKQNHVTVFPLATVQQKFSVLPI